MIRLYIKRLIITAEANQKGFDIMMSQKELQKYAEQDYKLVDPEYIKQLEQDSEKLIKFKKYSILAAFIAVIVIAITFPLLRALLTNLLN